LCIVYDSKTKENQLALVNELIVQLDIRVEYLIRQKTTLKMCKQDTTHVDELLLSVGESFVRTGEFKKRLLADLG
jgi:hypothetical protein